MNISERIQQDRVLRGTREFSDELAPLERVLAPREHGMAKPSASLVGAGTPARRPSASRRPASPGGRRGRPGRVIQAPALSVSRCTIPWGGWAGWAGEGGGSVCRAALPLQRELPGRRFASGGIGRGGGAPPPRGGGPKRTRRPWTRHAARTRV